MKQRNSVTQEYDFGCGIACYAFLLCITYKEAAMRLGEVQSKSNRFWVKNLTSELNGAGLNYQSKYVKPHILHLICQEEAIVLIGRSKTHPVGHYLVRHNEKWMDPWMNLSTDANIQHAKSGFRTMLPGMPKYVIFPVLF